MDEYPYCRTSRYTGGDRTNLRARGVPYGGDAARCRKLERELRATRSRTTCRGPRAGTTSSSGSSRAQQQDRARLDRLHTGVYNFGHSADNPLSTGNGYANALLGVFTTYTELDNRIDAETAHWQSDGYAQDSWRITPRVDARLRPPRDASRRDLRDAETRTRLSTRHSVEPRASADALPADCLTRRPRQSTVRSSEPTGKKPDSPARSCRKRMPGNTVPGSGSDHERHVRRGPAGRETGMVLRHARPFVGTARLVSRGT